MNLSFTDHGWNDCQYWLVIDIDTVNKIGALLNDIKRNPFKGLGKPEPLKNSLQGFWSRRITDEHRLVYRVSGTGENQTCSIIQCRFHY